MRKYNTTSTFVAAEPPAVELDPLMQHALTQTVERDIWVPLSENILGGCGLFIAVVCGRLWWVDRELVDIWWSTGYLAGIGTGVACVVRFWGDEFQRIIRYFWQLWAERRTNEELEWYKEECERLRQENRALSVANAQMTRNVGRAVEPVESAPRATRDEYTEPLRDALALCRFHEAHATIARDKAMSALNMSRSRWDAARQLLIDSGVTLNGSAIAISVVNAMGMVRKFVEKQRQAPSGFVMPGQD